MTSNLALPAAGRNVYVVDDDRAVRSALKFSLEVEGFVVLVFPGASEVLRDADLSDCGCLIVDLNMPCMNGLDLVDRLRQQRISMPAILITSHPSNAVRERAASAGVRLIEKPFLDNSLIEGVHDAFKNEGARPAH